MTGRMVLQPLVPLLCAVALAWQPVPDAAAADAATSQRPRIGLALSGGGARGAAHVGVLRVLEENRVPVDFISGTSMGALVGGLYASGLTPAQLDSVISEMDWMAAFADKIPREERSFRRKRDDDLYLVKNKPGLRGKRLLFPPGILDGQRIDLLLKRLTLPVVGVRDFDDLSIPYRCVAADIVTGEAIVLGEGDLALAMRASMSIPAAFAPREIGGRMLVDGGIADNLPIEVVRRMGADVIIAVDISTPPQGPEHLTSVIAITTQLATLASDREKDRQVATLGKRDVFIRPDLGSISVSSFGRAAEAIPVGESAARAALGELGRLAVSADEYRAWQAARSARIPPAGPPNLGALRIVNRSRLADAVIAARLDLPLGRPLDVGHLEQGLDHIFGLELFESVYYDIAREPQGDVLTLAALGPRSDLPAVTPGKPRGDVLTVTARERAWGPNYLQAGIAVFEDFEGPNFNLALAYSRTAVNRLNGEWVTGLQVGQEPGAWTEFHQPLDRGLRWFGAAGLSGIERSMNVFDGDGRKLSELGITHFGGVLAGGREIGTWGELRAGVVREGGTIRVQAGAPGPPDRHFDTGEAFAQFFVDKLDEVAFPHHGGSLRVRGSMGLDALGSTVEYEQLLAEGALAATRGHFTGILGGMVATTQDNDAPIESRFMLGGLGQLSGLEQDELVGQHAVLLRAMLYRRVVDFELLPVYAGLTAEYGNVFQDRSDMDVGEGIAAGSVLLGIDTLVGPLCIAYGRAEGDRGNFYLTLGQPLGGRRPGFRVR